MKKQYEQVKAFHEAFNHPVSDTPTKISKDRAKSRAQWMVEEIVEFWEAKNITDQADALIDLLYFAFGTLVEMGVQPEPIFDIVQEANMAKLWPDGNPKYREDGKILKPDNWEAPEPKIKLEIEKQIKDGDEIKD
jgi:predicted HAD superfamily Cof-like phosphohydrolase